MDMGEVNQKLAIFCKLYYSQYSDVPYSERKENNILTY